MIERKKKWKRMSQKKLCSCQMGVTQFVHSNRTMTKLTWLENQIWKNVICWVSPSVMGESLIPPLSNIIHSQMAFMIHRSTYLVSLPLIFSTCTLPFTLLPSSSSASNLAITKYQILKKLWWKLHVQSLNVPDFFESASSFCETNCTNYSWSK